MRIALIGASALAVFTAEILLKRGDHVIIVDTNKEKLQTLSDQLDCGFLHGDGSRPAVLRELGPEETDVLVSLTDNDRDNMLAALVGRSLGFRRVVPKIEDPELEHICTELGLTDTIVPDQSMARLLADMVGGKGEPELSTMVRGDVRFFSFVAGADDAGPVSALPLPERTRAVLVYRGDDFLLPDPDTEIAENDEVVLVTRAAALDTLRKRWQEAQSD